MSGRSGRVRMAALVVAAALVAGACGGDDGDDDVTGGTAIVPDVTTTSTTEADEPTSTTEPAPPPSVTDLSAAAITLTEVARVEAPTALAVRPGTDVLYVAERAGRVRPITFTPAEGGVRAEVGAPIVDVSTTTDGERGLLGLAFDADGSHLYLSYTDPNGDTQVDELAMDGDTVDAASRRPIFSTDQPFANHNGGQVSFGPDGYLYIALGDGGGGGDPLGTAQNPDDLLGSILRIDPTPSGDAAYTIPADNPFAGGGGRPEVWITGVRNPWRISWDRQTADLWVADVGQNAIEEITFLPVDPDGTAGRAANLGWPNFEGNSEFAGGGAPEGYVPPIFDYPQDPGCSVTGGYVSRGDALPNLRGAYLYSDFCDATIYALLQRDGQLVEQRSLGVEVPGGAAVSFGEGPAGELYVLSLSGGIHRIDPA